MFSGHLRIPLKIPLTVVESGIPHSVTDNIYKGYFVPAGSLDFANIWYVQQASSPLFLEKKRPLTRTSGIKSQSCIPRANEIQA